jgi:succinyl-diaminopimelate desuccinylase
MPTDPVKLTSDLIRCPSVTPKDEGALDVLASLLAPAGFEVTRVDRNGICNLFARWGDAGNGPVLGFNGHTDVVPIGDPEDWSVEPFGGAISDGRIWGRGACDMKSGVAAFAAAAIDFVQASPPDGSIALLITGDEEGDAEDGTVALLDWMAENGERMDHCLVGEPTCPETFGEMLKIGRRGSLRATIKATGKQGHSAYPHKALNPLPAMAELVYELSTLSLDEGSKHFQPSTLAVTTIDTGNPAGNVIPASCTASVNIRFNDLHSGADLGAFLQEKADKVARKTGLVIALDVHISGESFLTKPGPFSNLVRDAVETVSGIRPEFSTSGGTSDARFIQKHCPVIEFGLVGTSMHQVDEFADVQQIHDLKATYTEVLRQYFIKETV